MPIRSGLKKRHSILAMHDCPFPLVEWLDENFSMTWVNALSLLREEHDWEVLALGSTGPVGSSIELKGVQIEFHPKEDLWKQLLIQIKTEPEFLLLNIMDYNAAAIKIAEIRKISPKTKIVFRIHHEPFRLAFQQPGFIASLKYADLVISPMPFYNDFLLSLLNCKVITIPFGAQKLNSTEITKSKSQTNLILSITKNENPGKNFQLIKKLKLLSSDKASYDYRINITKAQVTEAFAFSTHFFQPSLSEASGSRILMEAFHYGLIPICFEASLSCAYIVQDCGGLVIPFKISRAYLEYETMQWSDYEANQVRLKIERLVHIFDNKLWTPPYFHEQFEVRALTKVLKSEAEGYLGSNLSSVIESIVDRSIDRDCREELSAKHIFC